ncbi:MAG: hypothetical protein QNI87_03075 [Erythrobacter sp.]|uniref:hypothetical protein n=1 Tax=Erythrobacter sp. TaxID=1042 RepID=UPI0026104063|nr:hypothetical protein [Erythrobacter sp.]MDJ0977493.1 hypothetical protein [Erythrobacter sp.]
MLTVSDPWSFLDENGSCKMIGTTEQIEASEMIVVLDKQFSSEGRKFDRVSVTPRNEESTLAELQSGKSISANISFRDKGFLIGSASLAEHIS